MVEIAVGTKVFMRTGKLQNLLNSIEQTPIERVYVADDGETTAEKEQLYNSDFGFDLRIIELEYDAGLGKGRKKIVDHLENEQFLLIVDTDHEVPRNVTDLADQLLADPTIGGIAGNLVEPDRGRLFQSAKDFHEEGNTLVRSSDLRKKRIEEIANNPFIQFQFIPNAAMFRVATLEDYCWDPNYVIGKEHIDFYVGHWKQTDWRFGVNPAVLFNHYPGGDRSYEDNRHSNNKKARSNEYFRSKWGYEAVRTDRSYWFDTEPIDRHTIPQRVLRVYRRQGAVGLLKKSLKVGPRVLRNALRRHVW